MDKVVMLKDGHARSVCDYFKERAKKRHNEDLHTLSKFYESVTKRLYEIEKFPTFLNIPEEWQSCYSSHAIKMRNTIWAEFERIGYIVSLKNTTSSTYDLEIRLPVSMMDEIITIEHELGNNV